MSGALHFQMFPSLPAATEAALRASIEQHGMLVPVYTDQHGRVIDGYHRSRIANMLDISYDTVVVEVRDDDHARELATTLNMDRRHLDPEQRRQIVADLRAAGHSYRAIGDALGVGEATAWRDWQNRPSTVPSETVDARVVGLDGRSRPATRRPAVVPRADIPVIVAGMIDDDGSGTADDEADAIAATLAAAHGDQIPADAVADAIAECNDSKRTPLAIPKNTAALGGIAHPARYSTDLLPVFARLLAGADTVLDPFAGTGRIHELRAHGYTTTGVEIEPEWATLHANTVQGDALALPFADGTFDAVCTSPTYGNRLADHHNASDPESRRSYTHDLGRQLHQNNSGAMQWGDAYREFHRQAWTEALRALKTGGLFVLNIKDHIRGGARQPVAGWHVTTIARLGATLIEHEEVSAPTLRQGANADLRLPEQVYLFRKGVR